MRHTLKLPKLGDTVDIVLVLDWLVELGDVITAGTPLLAVETDKVNAEVPSPLAGRVIERLVAPDDEVGIGAPIAVIES